MFKLKRINNTAVCAPAIKQIAATAGTYKIGEALVISSGKLAKATGTAMPEYICAQNKTASTTDANVSVYPIEKNQEYETTLAESGTVVLGSKVTIHTDSAQITTTTSNGVAEVLAVAGSALGDVAVVRF